MKLAGHSILWTNCELHSILWNCSPPTHPTKKWIDGYLKWYTDAKNPRIRVDGGATCNSDNDCLARSMGYPTSMCLCHWLKYCGFDAGPRCTKYIGEQDGGYEQSDLLWTTNCVPLQALTARVLVALAVTSFRRHKQPKTHLTTKTMPDNLDDDGQLEEEEKAVQSVSQRRFLAPTNLVGVTH
ncbi:hypothetical protein LEN26_011079 [Aphanomyces euteiches]|nr:hypothetical protein LEN26_011079 [Aphanomyces euteiches]KAH9125120.1 hypothetical protein AeMF1_004218 [Aphanomyces euteiches]KAH9185403.1 hypothetical protein AeNC1_012622 [Aphanomyces euteiches]